MTSANLEVFFSAQASPMPPDLMDDERASFHLPGQHDQADHGNKDGSGIDQAAKAMEAAAKAVGGPDMLVSVTAASSEDAQQLGSTLSDPHAYLDVLGRSTDAAPGTGAQALRAITAVADARGIHLLVSAEDDGSGKLFKFYEDAGFKRISSEVGDGKMMLRPAIVEEQK